MVLDLDEVAAFSLSQIIEGLESGLVHKFGLPTAVVGVFEALSRMARKRRTDRSHFKGIGFFSHIGLRLAGAGGP